MVNGNISDGKWEEVGGSSGMWMPVKVGDSVEGVIVELKQGLYGVQAVLKLVDNSLLTTPSHKVLQARLANCKIGDEVKISFEKEELPTIKGRQGTKIYKLLKKVN